MKLLNNKVNMQISNSSEVENIESKNQVVTAVDLFSGAGGFSLGALNVGVDIVGAIEYNPAACQTYAANIRRSNGSEVPLVRKSILDVSPFEAMQQWGIATSKCDIVIGGPPCQGFSAHRTLDSGVDDPRNELLCRYFEYVSAIRPRIFLVENVPGLLWKRHASYLERFYAMAKEANYDVHPPVTLNARDYGVPQNRKRVFLLGVDRTRSLEVTWPPNPTHFDPDLPKNKPANKKEWVIAANVFGPADSADPNNIHMNHNSELIEQFRNTPINGGSRHQSGRTLQCHVNHSGHRDVYGRIDPTKPGPTMTTACINPSKGRFVHPTENHGITLRQAARLQTFPDNFIFGGGLMAGGVQIGNAVPVELAKSLIQSLADAVKRASC